MTRIQLMKIVGVAAFLSASPALADPKVCGDQAVLGAFVPANCPTLKDDGVPPDDVAGDGIYTLEVQLSPAASIKYKVLPLGTYDGSEIGEVGTCGPTDPNQSPFRDLLILNPDTSKKTRFYYDSRDLSGDTSYAPAPNNRSFGDTIMAYAPMDMKPAWTVVGDVPGAPLDMTEVMPGVFSVQTMPAKDIPANWKWKVQEKSMAAMGVRQYRPEGWSYTPCKSMSADDVVVPSPVPAGQMLHLYFYAYTGRMQTVIGTPPDMLGQPDMRMAPPPDLSMNPPDLSTGPADLSSPPEDQAQIVFVDQGLEVPPGKLPGCHCQVGRHGGGGSPTLGMGLLLLAVVVMRRRRGQRML